MITVLIALLFSIPAYGMEYIIYSGAPIISRPDILVLTSFYDPDFDGYHTKSLSVNTPDFWYYHIVTDKNPHIQHQYVMCWITDQYLRDAIVQSQPKECQDLKQSKRRKKKPPINEAELVLYDISESDDEEKE